MARPIGTLETKLFKNVLVGDGCWLWQGQKNEHGYGIISMGRGAKTLRAHRACYEYIVEPIREGMVLCHKCDNPTCVRPDHMFQGTKKENTADMWSKGRGFTPFRGRYGSAHHNCKMTDEQIAECRTLFASGWQRMELAARYSVTGTQISRIVRTDYRKRAA